MENADRLDRQLRRFVLLRHDLPTASHGASHWDLMLETGDVLLTIQLGELPSGLPGQIMKAFRIADHRHHYLDYEGPISRNRGSVKRLAGGVYQDVRVTPVSSSHNNKPQLPPPTDPALRTESVPVETRTIFLESEKLTATIEVPMVALNQACDLAILQWELRQV